MDARSRAVPPRLAPGTDPIGLWVITGVVLVGLMLTGLKTGGIGSGGSRESLLQAAQARGPGVAGESTGRSAGMDPAARLRAARVRAARVPGAGALGWAPSAAAAGPAPGAGTSARSPAETAHPAALRLLWQAEAASRAADYQGVEVLAWRGPHGIATEVARVWHSSGAPALTGPAVSAPAPPGDTGRADASLAEGAISLGGSATLFLSRRLTAMLAENYSLAATGWGMVAGRPARILSVRRGEGGLAARIWLDRRTHLLLRRQVFDTQARLIGDVAFASVSFGRRAVATEAGTAAPTWGAQLAPAQLARLRTRGWPLPGGLPGRLALLDAREAPTASGPVVDLDYSDGLSQISVLVQRGHLPTRLAGWSPVAVEGHRVYADDPDGLNLAWSARGYVYTLISAAPPQTVRQVVATLPHDSAPSLLTRLERGLSRLLSYLRP